MRGSIYKRGGKWAIRYDAGIDERTGRRIQPSESGFKNQAEAEARLAQRLHEVATGRHVKVSKETFKGFSSYWLDVMMPGTVRATTLAAYAAHLRCVTPIIGHIKLQELKRPAIYNLYRQCEAKGLSARTIRHLHTRLSQILMAAVEEQIVIRNIMDDVTPPRVPAIEMHVWTADELQTFLTLTRDEIHGPLWHLLAMTGMRRGEALGLRWRDIDWQQGRLAIRQQAITLRGSVEVGPLKTTASERTVSIGPTTIAVLQAHRSAQNAIRLQAGKRWKAMDLVFARRYQQTPTGPVPGTPQSPVVISDAWHNRVRRTELPPIRLHDLRHTHATLMLQIDGNIKALAARLGHDPAMLLRTYAHTIPADQERAVARLEAAIGQANQARVAERET